MIHRIVQFALNQRFLMAMMTVFIAIGGIYSFQKMPVDAYPDLSPPMVEIITQWPGHAAEEVERVSTLPTEVEMNGVPKLVVQRSISLYGLSDLILTFDDDTDDYFARQVVFQRLSEVNYPTGVTPSLAPLSSPSGLVYRYVIESPDRSPQELKTFEDWVIERQYKQVRGVADDSGFGGTVMQYQVLLDPAKLYGYHITVPTVLNQLAVNNANTGGGFYSQGGQFYYVRGLGLVRDEKDIGNIIIGSQNGVPVRVRDIGEVTIGYAPRLGEFGFNKTDDAVEGVIMMLRGDQTQNVLEGVEKKTRDLNEHILPPDVKILPYYDRSDLVRLTTDTVEANLLRGMALVLIVLIFFLVSVRAAVIVALTIPLALLFSFIFLHARGVAANLLSIGAIDFGIIIDGTLVMVENVYRELGQPSLLIDVDREKIARYGINVADVETVVQAAVGGQAATQVIQGEKLFDLLVRMKPEFRESQQEIGNLLVGMPSGQQVPLKELADIREASGASFIYRENNSRYIGVQYSIEDRDLAGAVDEGQRAIQDIAKSLPAGYRLDWGGEYSEFLEAKQQMEVIGPLALLLIFMILFALYGNFKFPVTIALGVVMTEPVGALIALKLTGTPFSVSSVLGLLALMGVSVETAVILVSYINKLRLENKDIRTATREASLLRLRPIMMTALVACLGLLPAALSTGIGSDTQKPFAIVIVAGLISRLFLGFFVNPVLYEMVAREGDVLQV